MTKMRLFYGFAAVVFAVAVPLADSLGPITFESGFVAGSPNSQQGWVSLGSAPSTPGYDHAIVTGYPGAPASFGAVSLRVSDAVTSGSFGDQTFSMALSNEAGETAASNGGLSSGPRQAHFAMQIDIASALPTAQQNGLHLSMSPDRGDGARMSYLRVEDNAAGIDVFFDDVQQSGPCAPASCANFVETQVAGGLSRATPHSLGLSIDFIDGQNNDVVRVYVDGALVHTGTTWEGYYAFDPESSDGSPSRTVDSLLVRSSGDATPANAGKGFLLDNLKLVSSPIVTADSCKNGGWQTQTRGNFTTFKNQGDCVSYSRNGN